MDSNPMVSSLLNKLANYTNLSQGVVEHEEDEESRRREVKVAARLCSRVPDLPRPARASSPSLCFSVTGLFSQELYFSGMCFSGSVRNNKQSRSEGSCISKRFFGRISKSQTLETTQMTLRGLVGCASSRTGQPPHSFGDSGRCSFGCR